MTYSLTPAELRLQLHFAEFSIAQLLSSRGQLPHLPVGLLSPQGQQKQARRGAGHELLILQGLPCSFVGRETFEKKVEQINPKHTLSKKVFVHCSSGLAGSKSHLAEGF